MSSGDYDYPGSAGDPFGSSNPTTGPTDGPVTSNGAPPSGAGGASSPPSSNSGEGGGGTDSTDSGADGSTDAGTGDTSSAGDTSSSTSSGSTGTDATAQEAATSGGLVSHDTDYGQDGSVSGGGSGWSGDAIGGGDEPGMPGAGEVNLSSGGTTVQGGYNNTDYSGLRDALGIGAGYSPGMDSNAATAMTDPLASVDTATWEGQYPTQTNDSLVSTKTAYGNPDRMPVGDITDNLPREPKIADRVPQGQPTYGDALYDDMALSEITPSFDGPPVASSIPAAPGFDALSGISPPIAQPFNNTTVAQTGFPSGTQSAWGGGPPTTDVAQNDIGMPGSEMQLGGYDPLAGLAAALGVGGTPGASVAGGLPADPEDFAEIPRPAPPMEALQYALGLPDNTGLYPSRGDYQGMPYAGEAMVQAPQTGPNASEMAQTEIGDPRAFAGNYPSRGTIDPNGTEFVSAPETVRPDSSQAFAAANKLPDLRNYASFGGWNPPQQATDAAVLGSQQAIYDSPQYGKEENIAVNWDDAPVQDPQTQQQIATNEPLPDPEEVGPGVIGRGTPDPYARDPNGPSAPPGQEGIWGSRERRYADNAGSKGSRDRSTQPTPEELAAIEAERQAELEQELAMLRAKAAARSRQQMNLVRRNFA